MRLVKCVLCCLFFLLLRFEVIAQSYNTDKVALSNYLIRLFEQQPFEGVKVVDGYYNQYLISVVVFPISDASKEESDYMTDRIAEIEARSQATRFFNGSKITETDIIDLSDEKDKKMRKRVIKVVNEKSIGFIKALELLSKTRIDEQVVYFYSTEITR